MSDTIIFAKIRTDEPQFFLVRRNYMSNIIVLHTNQDALEYEFSLVRHTGKSSSLSKGNTVLNANDRLHFIVQRQISTYLRELSKSVVRSTNPFFSANHPCFTPEEPCSVLITISTPTRRRFDPPNLYPTVKALVDGMTDAGVWSDDNSKIIKIMAFRDGGVTLNKKYNFKLTIAPWQEE